MIQYVKCKGQIRELLKTVRNEPTTQDVEAFVHLYKDELTDALDGAVREFIMRKLGVKK